MELDVSYSYSSIFIFNFSSGSVFDISNLVLVLLLLLMFSRGSLYFPVNEENSLDFPLCLDEISLNYSDKYCICVSNLLSNFAIGSGGGEGVHL